jgi:hypothetical protein
VEWRRGYPPDATGMLAAIVAPLADGNVPVWVAASFDGDLVLHGSGVPADLEPQVQHPVALNDDIRIIK